MIHTSRALALATGLSVVFALSGCALTQTATTGAETSAAPSENARTLIAVSSSAVVGSGQPLATSVRMAGSQLSEQNRRAVVSVANWLTADEALHVVLRARSAPSSVSRQQLTAVADLLRMEGVASGNIHSGHVGFSSEPTVSGWIDIQIVDAEGYPVGLRVSGVAAALPAPEPDSVKPDQQSFESIRDEPFGYIRASTATPGSRPSLVATASAVSERAAWQWVPSVQFRIRSSRLEADNAANIVDTAELLTALPDVRVQLQAFTDTPSLESGNTQLALRRLAAVRQSLVNNGVPETRIVEAPMQNRRLLRQPPARTHEPSYRVELWLVDAAGSPVDLSVASVMTRAQVAAARAAKPKAEPPPVEVVEPMPKPVESRPPVEPRKSAAAAAAPEPVAPLPVKKPVPEPSTPVVKRPVEPAPAPKPAPVKTPSTPPVAMMAPPTSMPRPVTGDWDLNLATYFEFAAADRLRKRTAAAGYPAIVEPVESEGSRWYVVKIAGLESATDGQKLAAELEERMGLRGAWLTRR